MCTFKHIFGFFEVQFQYFYFPLTWMFYNRRANHLYERVLRLIYNNYELTFEEFFEKNGSFTIHRDNIQTLFIELYKIYHNPSQTIFSDLFTQNSISYNLRS